MLLGGHTTGRLKRKKKKKGKSEAAQSKKSGLLILIMSLTPKNTESYISHDPTGIGSVCSHVDCSVRTAGNIRIIRCWTLHALSGGDSWPTCI